MNGIDQPMKSFRLTGWCYLSIYVRGDYQYLFSICDTPGIRGQIKQIPWYNKYIAKGNQALW